MRIFLPVAALLLASDFMFSSGHDASPPEGGDPSMWKTFNFDTKLMIRNHRDCSVPHKPELINKLSYLNEQILYAIYSTELSNDILRSHTCSCEQLYPEYEHAIAVFRSEFVPMGLSAKPESATQAFIIRYKANASLRYADAVKFCIRLGVS